MIYTKEEFRKEWDENPECSITFNDIADCAEAWGLFRRARCWDILMVRYKVLVAANCSDASEYNPEKYVEV